MDYKDKINYTLKFGTYYNPATKHYGSNLAKVVCDNCQKENLKACVGWNDCDLCMQCIDRLNNELFYESIPKVDIPATVTHIHTMPSNLSCNNKKDYWIGPYGMKVPGNVKSVPAMDGINTQYKDGIQTLVFVEHHISSGQYLDRYAKLVDGEYWFK